LFSQIFLYALLPLLPLIAHAVPSLGDCILHWLGRAREHAAVERGSGREELRVSTAHYISPLDFC
jgi:hypothetical protein